MTERKPLTVSEIVRAVQGSAVDQYIEKLKAGVSTTDRVAHKHLLMAIDGVEKALRNLERMCPSREVALEATDAMQPFRTVLNKLTYPIALIDVSEKEDILPED